MVISEQQSNIIKHLISKSYSDTLSEKLLSELTPHICSLLDIHYFAAVIFTPGNRLKNIMISNNPHDFNELYDSFIDQDFILSNMIESNRPVVFRELIDRNVPYSHEFVQESQKVRPASDGCYVPLRLDNKITGFFGVARAGLDNKRFEKKDVELFNFAVSFLEEGFRKALYPEPDNSSTAYLNKYGEVVFCGSNIKESFTKLFGEKYCENPLSGTNEYSKLFSDTVRVFTSPLSLPGSSEIKLAKSGHIYHFSFSRLSSPEYRALFPKDPQYSVILREKKDFTDISFMNTSKVKEKYSLTNRETEVVDYICRGFSNREISVILKTAESTVKRHVWNIFNKTGTESRTQLIFKVSA